MINNNPYNIPEKKPLSQSKIFSETNTSRHSSTYMQNRGNNQMMYNSSIFMKNSSIINGHTDQPFFEPIREPLSPHSIYPKPSPNAQFIPNYSNIPIRPHEMNSFPVSSHKDMNVQKGLNELKQKIERIEKRLQVQEKREASFNELQNKKTTISETNSVRQIVQENLNNSAILKSIVDSIVQQSFQTQNNKILLKLKDLDESISSSINHVSAQKLSRLQDSFLKSQSEKNHDEQLMNRIKTIEKTIRQMGEDIHLVNDKEEHLSVKIENELPWIRNEIKGLKQIDKIIGELENNNNELRTQIQEILRKLHSLQSTTESSLTCKIQQIQQKIDGLKGSQKDYKASFERYFSEPIVLKYLQKFRVSNQKVSKNSYTNSTKGESCQEILVNEITYFIDSEGYLLDNDRFYLITGVKNQRVRLDMKHIQLLKDNKILI